MWKAVLVSLAAAFALSAWPSDPVRAQAPLVVTYDIVYVRAPRPTDRDGHFTEVFRPFSMEGNSDLVLLHPDGSEEILVDAAEAGAVADPFVTFDGQWVLYSYFPDVLRINDYPAVPLVNADLWKVNVATKQRIQLTHGEWTPNKVLTEAWRSFNMAPTPLAGGRIAFVSNRNGLQPPKGYTPVTFQVFTMNADGSGVELITPMTLGAALHPFQLTDGRIAFSTFESQGVRDARLWGYWSIWEDGTTWEPLSSAFMSSDTAQHFASQLSNGDVVIEGYYNFNNQGFGTMFKFPVKSPTAPIGFQSPVPANNVGVEFSDTGGRRYVAKWPMMPVGATAVTPFAFAEDRPAPIVNGMYQGKVTHPSGAPGNDLLLVWSPGPVNTNGPHLPYIDAGIYIAHNGFANTPGDLVLVKNDPNFNEQWPRAVVPYSAVYGIPEPKRLPVNPNNGLKHPALPAGTPFGITGTASVFQRESAPAVAGAVSFDGLEPFFDCFGQCSNWVWQGSDAGKYTNADIGAMRIVVMEGRSIRQPNNVSVTVANERLRILGEVPINADGSFAVKLPADTPFTFQLLDKGGSVLTMAQTWHQVRPGEVRVDCGGCHSHSKLPLDFATSAAATLPPVDLTLQPAHDVEFVKDIRPILQAKCARCHTASGPAPRLDSTAPTTTAVYPDEAGWPADFASLARNAGPSSGPGVMGRLGGSRTSRWVWAGQSRRSVIMWTLRGMRTDGWANDRWPTEAVPGDASTFPAGANKQLADLDFRVDHSGLVTDAERRTFAAWIDLFLPFDMGGGFFVDETRPTLSVVADAGQLVVGAADAYSGVNAASLSVTVNGAPVALTPISGSRWTAPASGTVKVLASVQDNFGNLTRLSRTVTVTSAPAPVNCIVSAWSDWSAWTPVTATTEQRTRTRSVTTQPANGGTACPALSETETRAIALPAPTGLHWEGGAILTRTPTQAGFPKFEYPRIVWNLLPGITAYQVDLTWSSGTPIWTQAPVLGDKFAPLPMGQPGHQYRARVRGCSLEPPQPCNGAWSNWTIVER